MDRSVRIAVAAAVLLVGVLAAMVFRRGDVPPPPPPAAAGEPLPLRREATMERRVPPAVPAPPVEAPVAPGRANPPRFLAPLAAEKPPAMAAEYPGMSSTTFAPTIEKRPTVSLAPARPQKHRIVDGDSLESLAQKYLGAASRAGEIYEANRQWLPGPSILPIGKELVIPPASGGGKTSRGELAPVPGL